MGTQLGQVETQLKTSGDQGIDTFHQGLDQQISTIDQTFGDKAAGVRAKMNDQATSAANKAGEPVGTVGQRIDEAHARIDAKAKESQKSWLERQFDSLVNMLTDPGFWAGLIVGLVLAAVVIALLPAELTVGIVLLAIAGMAVVGALAAGVGTIVSNVCAGRPWDQNLGTNMLVGAIFGAALFGAALLLPEGIATYVGLSVLAGVLTVITNLATGRPWDEGLLANMLLVGVLAWLGKFLPRPGKGGPVEDPNKPPVDDPNRPNTNQPDPNQPDPNRPNTNQPQPPATDPWAAIARKHNLAPDAVDQLRSTTVDPAVADRMLARGVTPADIVRLSTTYGPDGVRAIDNLVSRGIQARIAEDALRIAKSLGIQGDVTDLVNSGNLENPASLRNFLQKIAAEMANGQRGAMNELLEAVSRAREGHRVSLGGRAFNPSDPESGQADVVDHTAHEAVQMKTVTSAAEDKVVSNLQSAVDQLGGSGGETPPTGYERTADVRITNPDNPLFNADRTTVQNALRGQISNLDNLDPPRTPPGHVRISNGNPGSPFTFTAGELR